MVPSSKILVCLIWLHTNHSIFAFIHAFGHEHAHRKVRVAIPYLWEAQVTMNSDHPFG